MISLPFVDNFFCACGNGMIESMLEPHLKSAAGADQMQIGITFLILGGFYMATTPVVGYVRIPYFMTDSNGCPHVDFRHHDQEVLDPGLYLAN